MNLGNEFPKKQNVYKGMWYLITNTKRFVLSAAENSMAFELEKEEYQRKLEQGTLYTILCKCLFSEVTVQAVTELDNKAAHCHTPVPQRHRPFL